MHLDLESRLISTAATAVASDHETDHVVFSHGHMGEVAYQTVAL